MKPHEIDDATFAFPASVSKLMPDYKSIPEDFKDFNKPNKWNEIISRWFFGGLPPETHFVPKKGIDGKKALRHIATILRSFEPKHEHKEAACAYLLSQWFEDVIIPK